MITLVDNVYTYIVEYIFESLTPWLHLCYIADATVSRKYSIIDRGATLEAKASAHFVTPHLQSTFYTGYDVPTRKCRMSLICLATPLDVDIPSTHTD